MIGYAWLSVATALVTLVIKLGAYRLTNSVGLLSDALESLVNLSAAALAVFMLHWASRPPDRDHAFGHEKGEYISAGVEGALILVAAGSIFISASQRLLHPIQLSEVGVGLGLSLLASLANAATAWALFRAAKKHQSVALHADAHHLMSDVYTSAAVVAGVALVALTDWPVLDPIIALLAGLWITRTGLGILRSAADGMLDVSLPDARLAQLEELLARYRSQGIDFHALRTRQAGRSCYIQLHVLVPGDWSVLRGHNLLEEIEAEIRLLIPGARLHTHLEPLEDPKSFQDIELED
ncbi:MAG: cation transporter [Candidatus Eremiobacteraeota bacterium]|nr:cation transporter [Candidatus Eremiobacteraeota bacterium]MCW5868912.1 cation transporter [Candidatus Eremiobacteraeota bacterium]